MIAGIQVPESHHVRFSVVVSTYNREEIVRRCVNSCLAQDHPSFEVVVVDDGSSDGTVSALKSLGDTRLKVVSHAVNQGMSAARATGVAHAQGEWILIVDSDWELRPGALTRLDEIISAVPEHVRVVWYRLLWDDGTVSPTFVPVGPVTYLERLAWAEAEGGSDASRCVHRSVYERTPYVYRQGTMDWLYELDLAQNETAVYVSDVLGEQHFDAPNSFLRQSDAQELAARLRTEAADMLWMAETTLKRHGAALEEHNPTMYVEMLRVASRYAFLLSRRHLGLRYARRALAKEPCDFEVFTGVVLGLAGTRPLLAGIILRRKIAAALAKRVQRRAASCRTLAGCAGG
jgi:CTP:molybdopterin cytidylyltransferase MocA